MARDYYAVLGVEVSASSVQIRRAYQRLARRYSPDVNLWEQNARDLFREIAEAYRVLSDPMARTVYDHRQMSRTGESPHAGSEVSGRRAGRRGDDLHIAVELAFQQAVSGFGAGLPLDRLSPCGECGASGAARGSAPVGCDYCSGLGTIWTTQREPRPERCPACDGSGARVPQPCSACRGRGVRMARVTLRVTLPPGIDTGAQVRFEGEGHSGPFGGPRGDVIVIARVHEDPTFTRRGDNLYCEMPFSIVEAVLGARVPVRGVDGDVDLVVPPGVQSGQVFKMRGRGMPRLSGAGRGDLCVTARVEIPRGLDARTQELFRELGRLLPRVPRAARGGNGRS